MPAFHSATIINPGKIQEFKKTKDGLVAIWPNNRTCKLAVHYTDERYDICGGSYKIFRSWLSGRNATSSPRASRVKGTGVPDKMNLGPITPGPIGEMAGHPLPSLGLTYGLVPFKAVALPLPAKNA